MIKLLKKNPLTHALAWIGIYVVSVNVLDGLSATLGEMHLMTSFGLLGLSLIAIFYLNRHKLLNAFGLKSPDKHSYRKTLYCLPLVILGLSQFSGTLNPSLNGYQIALIALLMLNLGFLEELFFRGFLFQAIQVKSGTTRAIIISGVTFGLGHIVNLMRGMSLQNQVEQIVLAIVIGIVLAKIVSTINSLMPGILFHIIFNFSGSIMVLDARQNTVLLFSTLIIASLYLLYLMRIKPKQLENIKFQTQA